MRARVLPPAPFTAAAPEVHDAEESVSVVEASVGDDAVEASVGAVEEASVMEPSVGAVEASVGAVQEASVGAVEASVQASVGDPASSAQPPEPQNVAQRVTTPPDA